MRWIPWSALLLAGCAGGSQVSEVALPVCEDPADRPILVDGLPGSGVTFSPRAVGGAPDLSPDAAAWLLDLGGAVVAADLDQDGHDDLFLGQGGGASELYWGRGDGTFDPADGFADPILSGVTAAAAADFDGDGRLDLAVGTEAGLRLLRQVDGRRFEDVAAAVGIRSGPGLLTALAWGDPDRDGDLDLFVGRYAERGDPQVGGLRTGPSELWRDEVGSFSDQRAALHGAGVDGGATLHARWADLDDDGDLDLIQTNDLGAAHVPGALLRYRGGFDFEDRRDQSGLRPLEVAHGALVRDLDGDGALDLWFTGVGSQRIARSDGAWSWADASLDWTAGVPADLGLRSWSLVDLDVDGDGTPELFVTYGAEDRLPGIDELPPAVDQPDLLLVPRDGAWTPGATVPGDGLGGRSRGAALADWNEDGVPDLAVARLDAPPALLFGRCTANARLVVRLRDRSGYNRLAVGAKVTVEAGGRTASQEVVAGGRGSFSGGSPDLFFGLGDAGSVDSLRIRWPDGQQEDLGPTCGGCRVTVDRRLPAADQGA